MSGRPPRMTLTVGDPPRTLQLDADTASTAHAYLRGRRHGPLLLGERRPRHADRLTRFGIDYVVKQAAQAAGLAGTVSRNTLRRRYVVAAHARGVDLDDFVAAPDTPTNGRPAAISHRRLRARTLIETRQRAINLTPPQCGVDPIP